MGNITLYADDGLIRGMFKTYFLLFFLILGAVGNHVCRQRTKLKLLRGQKLTLAATTGWVKGVGSFAKSVYELRSIPGEWLGWIMILITILNLAGDYAAGIVVKARFLRGSCLFDTGLVVNADAPARTPSLNYQAYYLASQAQYNAKANRVYLDIENTTLTGIYREVSNDTYFVAQDDDFLGWWSCYYNESSITYTGQTDNDIWLDMNSKGLLYDDVWLQNVSSTDTSLQSYGLSNQFFAISPSNKTLGAIWDIRAAVDLQDTDNGNTKVMQPFHCVLNFWPEDNTVEKIIQQIDIHDTLREWSAAMQGAFYPGLHATSSYPPYFIEFNLEQYLNSMVMVSGSGEITDATSPGARYGCLANGTVVPTWVIGLASTLLIMLVILTAYSIYLILAIRTASLAYDNANADGSKVTSKEIKDNAPNGLMDWMTHAAYESRDAKKRPEPHQLQKWILSTSWHGGKRLGIVREHEHGISRQNTPAANGMTSYFNGQQAPAEYTGYNPSEPFMPQKGEYTAVHTNEVR